MPRARSSFCQRCILRDGRASKLKISVGGEAGGQQVRALGGELVVLGKRGSAT